MMSAAFSPGSPLQPPKSTLGISDKLLLAEDSGRKAELDSGWRLGIRMTGLPV